MMITHSYIWDSQPNITLLVLLGLVVLFIHFIPSFIAISRNHPSELLILILNIFFGWTGIVWILLLIWALSAPASATTK